MTRIAVLGAKGRMGSESVRAITATDGLEVVAEIDQGDPLELVTSSGAEVALDFTQPGVALDNVTWCVEHGVHVVVGTSGFDDERIAAVRSLLGDEPATGVLIVPNFSIGAILMMRFAQTAAPFFESVEVIEMHHPDKIDAPSGTAVRTAELIAAARSAAGSAALPDATTTDPDGARGATVDGVPVHAGDPVRRGGGVLHDPARLPRPRLVHARRRRRRQRRPGPPRPDRRPRRGAGPVAAVYQVNLVNGNFPGRICPGK
jgi:4-hydroxy-tetrahydrodipicolinate reductase